MVTHRLAQRHGGEEVVVVILQRHAHGFAHGLQPREVDDAVDVVLGEYLVEHPALAHVLGVEVDMLAGDLFHALYRLRLGIDEVVDHDDLHAPVQKLHAGVAAYVPGSACN